MATVSNSVQGMFSSTFSGIAENTGSDGGGAPVPAKTAFAVYSADDGSLDFYKRSSVPNAGDSFEGKTVTKVYTGFEADHYGPAPDASDNNHETTVPWFSYRNQIQSVMVVDCNISPESLSYWFQNCSNLKLINLDNLDTSRTSSLQHTFFGCSVLQTLNLYNLDVSQVSNMDSVFTYDISLTSINLTGWLTSSLTNSHNMFSLCYKLERIDGLSSFDVSKDKDLINMFSSCRSLKSLDLTSWNIQKNIKSFGMFSDCTSLESIAVGDSWYWPNDIQLPGTIWYALSDGWGYAPSDVPSGVADTYYATKALRDAAANKV